MALALIEIIINGHGIHGRHRNYLSIFRVVRVLPWTLVFFKYKNDIPLVSTIGV